MIPKVTYKMIDHYYKSIQEISLLRIEYTHLSATFSIKEELDILYQVFIKKLSSYQRE